MSIVEAEYFYELAAAFVRGRLSGESDFTAAEYELLNAPKTQLTSDRFQQLFELGKARGLKMHKFKKATSLARVRSVLGILRGLQPLELLDVGSGRGVFLWPFLEEFPCVPVTCVDSDPIRVRDILAVRDGGIERLCALEADITKLDLPDRSFDVVTFLEVLEHIPDAQAALNKVVQLARRFIVLSVPSHEDDNEGHVHLFSKSSLNSMLANAGAQQGKFQYVLNHMIIVASVSH